MIRLPYWSVILDLLVQWLASFYFAPSFLLFCSLRPSNSHCVFHAVRILSFLPWSLLASITKGQQAPNAHLWLIPRHFRSDLSVLLWLQTAQCNLCFLLDASSPSLCKLSFLCLVPSFNCTWYLDPSYYAFTKSYEVSSCHSTISTGSHLSNLSSIFHSKSLTTHLLLL